MYQARASYNKNEQNLNRIDNCNYEEADTRVILHAVDGSQTYKNILIVNVDTDVVIIALCNFFPLSLNELWVEFGVGQIENIYLYVKSHTVLEKKHAEPCQCGSH